LAAFAGAVVLATTPYASAAPIAPLPSGESQVIQVRQKQIYRRKNVNRNRGGYNRNYARNRGGYNRNYARNYRGGYNGNRYRNYNNRWVYDQRRYGPRYAYRRSGYNYYRDGYYYSSPWWGAGAGLAAGAIIGATVANSAAQPVYDDHYAWCSQRYRSYDPNTDTFIGSNGLRRRCYGP